MLPMHYAVRRPFRSACAIITVSGLMGAVPSALAQRGGGSTAEALWTKSCLQCHGEKGLGGPLGTPSLLDEAHFDPSLDRRFFDQIKNGKIEAGMPPFGEVLSDEQMWSLVVHVRELQAQDRRKRVGSISRKPDENGLIRTQHHRYRIQTVIGAKDTGPDGQGLSVPWSVEFVPVSKGESGGVGGGVGGLMLVANRNGDLRVHSTGLAGGTLSAPLAGTPKVRNRGQGGLMDIALHPKFEKNGWIYLAYSDGLDRDGKNQGMTKIVRGKIGVLGENGPVQWKEQQTIFEAKPEHYVPTDLHFGCRIVFDPADPTILFFGIGERGLMDMAQDLTRPNGKIHRVRDDGTIPEDNPFNDQASIEAGIYPSIWSFGHRNPQGLVFDLHGQLWDTEHGPRGGDELNAIEKGRNYGWPVVSFGINYSDAPFRSPFVDVGDAPALLGKLAKPGSGADEKNVGMRMPGASEAERVKAIVMPIDRWLPSVGVCGLDVVRIPDPKVNENARAGTKGDRVFKEAPGAFVAWEGDLIAGGLSGSSVDRFRVGKAESGSGWTVAEREEIVHGLGRVRDVVCAPDGTIYVVLNDPDSVIRLVAE
jgi:glucose/arabinose dehydrogenase/cytochrome c5